MGVLFVPVLFAGCGERDSVTSNGDAVRDFLVLHVEAGVVSESAVSDFADVLRGASGARLIVGPPMTEAEYAELCRKTPAEAEKILKKELAYSAAFRSLSRRLIDSAGHDRASVASLKRVISFNREQAPIALWGLALDSVDRAIEEHEQSHAQSSD